MYETVFNEIDPKSQTVAIKSCFVFWHCKVTLRRFTTNLLLNLTVQPLQCFDAICLIVFFTIFCCSFLGTRKRKLPQLGFKRQSNVLLNAAMTCFVLSLSLFLPLSPFFPLHSLYLCTLLSSVSISSVYYPFFSLFPMPFALYVSLSLVSLSLCLFVSLSLCLFVYLSLRLFVSLSLCLFISHVSLLLYLSPSLMHIIAKSLYFFLFFFVGQSH